MELRNISKSYGRVNAVKEKSLTLRPGSTLCVVGRNGSGKSTLLKIAAMLTMPDAGSVILDGKDLAVEDSKTREEVRNKSIGYSFQEPLLIPYLTAIENTLLASFSSDRVKSAEAEARKLLSQMGLSHRLTHIPSKLSGGEKKKVDLARALLRNPRILVADEPLSGLDPDSADIIIKMLRNFTQSGGSLIYSAVDPDQAKWADSATYLET